jgi:4'-phosphopantetheinyl transferase
MGETLYWLAQSSGEVPDSDGWLSEGERGLLAGMRFAKRRHDWRLGRWTAKLAIRAYQRAEAAPLSALEIRAAADGAPEAFWDAGPAQVSLSISHSHDRSLCVVGPSALALGCDLERIEPRDDFILDYFTPEEASFAARAPAADRAEAVNLIWCAKETALKILREGMRRDARSIRIRPDRRGLEGSWNTWTGRCLESSRVFYGWWRSWDGYLYTLASDQPTSAPEQLPL